MSGIGVSITLIADRSKELEIRIKDVDTDLQGGRRGFGSVDEGGDVLELHAVCGKAEVVLWASVR